MPATISSEDRRTQLSKSLKNLAESEKFARDARQEQSRDLSRMLQPGPALAQRWKAGNENRL